MADTGNTADVVKALAPAFATGFAVQHLLEILDPVLSTFLKDGIKKPVLVLVSLVCGLAFANFAHLTVLGNLGVKDANGVDLLVTGLIISAGTEGFNSIIKFLGYAKDGKKVEAQGKAAVATAEGATTPPPSAGKS